MQKHNTEASINNKIHSNFFLHSDSHSNIFWKGNPLHESAHALHCPNNSSSLSWHCPFTTLHTANLLQKSPNWYSSVQTSGMFCPHEMSSPWQFSMPHSQSLGLCWPGLLLHALSIKTVKSNTPRTVLLLILTASFFSSSTFRLFKHFGL